MTFQIALFPPGNAEGIKKSKLSGTMEKKILPDYYGVQDVTLHVT
jgi:hypothetical protein